MCLFCEKGPFGTMINLADHMTTDHSFKESGELKADLGVDKSSGALIRHNSTVHKNTDDFMCLFCEKGPFGTMINLAEHMTTDHSFEESGELKANLGVNKRGNGKEFYEMFLNYQYLDYLSRNVRVVIYCPNKE